MDLKKVKNNKNIELKVVETRKEEEIEKITRKTPFFVPKGYEFIKKSEINRIEEENKRKNNSNSTVKSVKK